MRRFGIPSVSSGIAIAAGIAVVVFLGWEMSSFREDAAAAPVDVRHPGLSVAAGDPQTPVVNPQPWRVGRGRGFGALYSDMQEMSQFLLANSPNRMAALESLSYIESGQIRAEMLRRWRAYKLLSERFPQLAAIQVQRLRLQDDLFGLMMDARRRSGVPVDSYRDTVQQKATQLVHLEIQSHQLRVQKLEDLLANEKKKLAESRANEDREIASRTNAMMKKLAAAAAKAQAESGTTGSVDQTSAPQ